MANLRSHAIMHTEKNLRVTARYNLYHPKVVKRKVIDQEKTLRTFPTASKKSSKMLPDPQSLSELAILSVLRLPSKGALLTIPERLESTTNKS